MPPPFDVVVFDLDHTLFDFELSKHLAFERLLDDHRVPDPDGDLVDRFSEWAAPLWRRLEDGTLTLATLNQERFELLVERAGLSADPAAMAVDYLALLGGLGGLLPGARDLLDTLASSGVRMALASNGYGEVQRARLDQFDLGRYFDAVAISGELGHAKPSPAFFERLFAELDRPDPAASLMVGDSLTSDMAGGRAFGMVTCWYAPQLGVRPAEPIERPLSVDHVVTDLAAIADLAR
ncbi:MAG: HAD family hydrolase [Acidimicrobiales bacterium]